MTWMTSLRASGIHLPLGSFIGLGERLEEIDEPTYERDLCGALVVLRPLWGPKYRVSLQATGPAIRYAPAFLRIDKGTDLVTLDCITRWTDVIPAGSYSTVLVRPPAPGSVSVVLATDERVRVPFTVNGSTVQLVNGVNANVAYTVRYHPRLQAVLTQRSTDTPEITGNMAWNAVFEEA